MILRSSSKTQNRFALYLLTDCLGVHCFVYASKYECYECIKKKGPAGT